MAEYDITAIGSPLEFDISFYADGATYWIDSTHFLLNYSGQGQDGYSQVFTINSSGILSAVGTGVEFDINSGQDHALSQIDATHYLAVWRGLSSDGFAQVLAVNLSTWNVTTLGTALEFDIDNCVTPSVTQIDSSHYLVAWGGLDTDGYAQVLQVNLSTWAVTTLGTAFEHDIQRGEYNSLFKINDEHYFLTFTGPGGQCYSKVLTVNLSTWAVNQIATSVIQLSSSGGQFSDAAQLDSHHYCTTWSNTTSPFDVRAQIVEVNPTTYAITALGSSVTVGNAAGTSAALSSHVAVRKVGDAVIFAWRNTSGNGLVRALTYDGSWNLSLDGTDNLTFDSGTINIDMRLVEVSDSRFIIIWSGLDNDGYIQAFDIALPSGGPVEISASDTQLITSTESLVSFLGYFEVVDNIILGALETPELSAGHLADDLGLITDSSITDLYATSYSEETGTISGDDSVLDYSASYLANDTQTIGADETFDSSRTSLVFDQAGITSTELTSIDAYVIVEDIANLIAEDSSNLSSEGTVQATDTVVLAAVEVASLFITHNTADTSVVAATETPATAASYLLIDSATVNASDGATNLAAALTANDSQVVILIDGTPVVFNTLSLVDEQTIGVDESTNIVIFDIEVDNVTGLLRLLRRGSIDPMGFSRVGRGW